MAEKEIWTISANGALVINGESEDKIQEMSAGHTYGFVKTVQQLKRFHLRIPMNGEKTWILNKTNVKVALRKMGIEAEEMCLTLPSEAITEPQQITVGITINQQETVFVKGTVYNVYKDPSGNDLPDFPPVWSKRRVKTKQVDV